MNSFLPVRRIRSWLVAFALLALAASPGFAETVQGRKALVIGNSKYAQAPLTNPENDAKAIRVALEETGFQVQLKLNRTRAQMIADKAEFAASIEPGDVALFYYAGHGVQNNGVNYLIPIDNANLVALDGLEDYAVNAASYLQAMSSKAPELNLFFLDACRNAPLPPSAVATRSAEGVRGLASMAKPPGVESVIVYSTQANTEALDGTGANSPFTLAIIRNIKIPDQELPILLNKVAIDVSADTKGKQEPSIVSGKITSAFSFVSTTQAAALARRAKADNQARIDALNGELERLTQADSATKDQQKKDQLAAQMVEQRAKIAAAELLAKDLADRTSKAEAAARAQQAKEDAAAQELAATQASAREARAKLDDIQRQVDESRRNLSKNMSPDQYLAQIESNERAIARLYQEFGAMKDAQITQAQDGYRKELASLQSLARDPWESKAEFAARVANERATRDGNNASQTSAIEARITASLKEATAKYSDVLKDLNAGLTAARWNVADADLEVQYDEFDAERKVFPIRLVSKNPALPFRLSYDWAVKAGEETRTRYAEMLAALRAPLVLGQVEYAVVRNSQGLHDLVVRTVSIYDNLKKKSLYSADVKFKIAVFSTGNFDKAIALVDPKVDTLKQTLQCRLLLPALPPDTRVYYRNTGRELGLSTFSSTQMISPTLPKGKLQFTISHPLAGSIDFDVTFASNDAVKTVEPSLRSLRDSLASKYAAQKVKVDLMPSKQQSVVKDQLGVLERKIQNFQDEKAESGKVLMSTLAWGGLGVGGVALSVYSNQQGKLAYERYASATTTTAAVGERKAAQGLGALVIAAAVTGGVSLFLALVNTKNHVDTSYVDGQLASLTSEQKTLSLQLLRMKNGDYTSADTATLAQARAELDRLSVALAAFQKAAP